MVDIVDARTRSQMMSNIRGKDTKPELALRRALHARGFRFRLHVKDVPGRPDIVFPKYRAAVFVHGCFWHRHAGCRYATVPKTRPEFWKTKFAANVSRDAAVHDKLTRKGWRVATVWECVLRNPKALTQTAEMVATWLKSDEPEMELGELQVEPH
ncbi:very short patch repair endonuclease [Tritonibacter mobilis]|uniref:very short patch repair endonuclease n=1 Tax=Tritonibacter mobilis TaxID=379347 RepID=UPI000806EEE6|nr:very short patch repair endonuclease [Tritonibacter mobilis]